MDLTLLLTGAIVSVIVQIIKKYFGTDKLTSLGAAVIVSLLAGVGMYFVRNYGLIDASLEILVTAGAVYAFIIKTWQDSQFNLG